MYRDYLVEQKEKMKWTTEQLSARSGVPVGTINKILSGETVSPRYDTISALNQAFEESRTITSILREMSGYYVSDPEDHHTLEDYYRLPGDVRAELIDGRFYYMASPTPAHQEALTGLLIQFSVYIRSHKGDCQLYPAPLDVQLDSDIHTMVQPDFLVVCDKNKIKKDRICGAPDFIAEILSPSSRKLDSNIKLLKYLQAGVKEYWLVDPEAQRVICYFFAETGLMPCIYPFDQEIPVQLYLGELTIRLGPAAY